MATSNSCPHGLGDPLWCEQCQAPVKRAELRRVKAKEAKPKSGLKPERRLKRKTCRHSLPSVACLRCVARRRKEAQRLAVRRLCQRVLDGLNSG